MAKHLFELCFGPCRYQHDVVPFEWYQKYDGLRDLIKKYIHATADILMLGCGNSGEGTLGTINTAIQDLGFLLHLQLITTI